MTAEDAERYRRKAEECRANARTATDDVDRAAWLRLAEDWMELARSVDSPIGAGTISAHISSSRAVRLSWLGRSAPELV
jgi:hypothetical protein